MSKNDPASPDSLKTALKPAAERKQVFRAATVAAQLEGKTVEEFVGHVSGQRQLYAPGHRKNWSKGRMKVSQAISITSWVTSEGPEFRQSVSRELDERSILAGLMSAPECPSKAEILRDAIELMGKCLAPNRTEG